GFRKLLAEVDRFLTGLFSLRETLAGQEHVAEIVIGIRQPELLMRRSSGLVVHRKARGKPGAEGRLRVSQAAGLAEDGAKLLVGVCKRTDVRTHDRQLPGHRPRPPDA